MPIKIPEDLPTRPILEDENILTMTEGRVNRQDIRPLGIITVNLMPTRVVMETQLLYLLGNTPLRVNMTFLWVEGYESKNIAPQHLERFYKMFPQVHDSSFNDMVIIDAPVEQPVSEEVDHWDKLVGIMNYAKGHMRVTLCIYWGVQAGLYYHYGVPKCGLPYELPGIFSRTINDPTNQLFRGFGDVFHVSYSRHTEIRGRDIAKIPSLKILVESDEAGVFAADTLDGRSTFVTGHPEYNRDVLDAECRRDAARGVEIAPLAHYYPGDNAARPPLVSWWAYAHLSYSSWLNYCVYQVMPYRLDDTSTGRDQVRPRKETGHSRWSTGQV